MKRYFVLCHAEARKQAILAINSVPDGWVAKLSEPTRNLEINAALHARIGEIADSMTWVGKKWGIEVWKRLLVAAWTRATGESTLILPALDGHGVDVVFRRTSELSQAECRDLLAFIECWQAENEETCQDA